ncbi:phosphatase PAP2 family protein [Kutzneria kofuensis]|uniref:Undecaprenyl-diphosphatase n=1 Tax=Kutzneria kofuensis TaxID=103725 RepID=A0A7W9NFB5_9PSEU|nr:phosphatase PAP2 family protein [Kutzneria kofuensis]MBB5890349.1 undecaprenyl-diphosphatase [Kutzneria kofuensis]
MQEFDDGVLTVGTALARATGWLHLPVEVFSDYGFVLFVLLWALCWRRGASRPALLAALVAPPVAWLISIGLKVLVTEPRPCLTLKDLYTVQPCDPPTDYSFPSNHATIAFAAAVAILVLDRRLGLVALIVAVLIGATRVYLGVHYPHDVLAGAFVGSAVAYLLVKLTVRARGGRTPGSAPPRPGPSPAPRR